MGAGINSSVTTPAEASEFSRVSGGNYIEVTSSEYQAKATLSDLNKWHCVSIHWEAKRGAGGKRFVWANGKKLKSFTAASSLGATTMVFGDINPTKTVPLDGDVQMFLLYKGYVLDDLIIKAHHKMICERYSVDHARISFP